MNLAHDLQNKIHIVLLFMLSLTVFLGIYTEFTDGHNLGFLPVHYIYYIAVDTQQQQP
jgi:hypothetical protein